MTDRSEAQDAAVVAAEVSEACNNPFMEGILRLHLHIVERHGFAIVRTESCGGDMAESGRSTE